MVTDCRDETSTNKSKVSNIESKAKTAGGAIGHLIVAENESTFESVKVDSEIQIKQVCEEWKDTNLPIRRFMTRSISSRPLGISPALLASPQ